MQRHCSFTVQDFVLQTYIKQNKTDTPKFKIVLSKGILRTFTNSVDSDQDTESDRGHHCLHAN